MFPTRQDVTLGNIRCCFGKISSGSVLLSTSDFFFTEKSVAYCLRLSNVET